MIYAKNPQSVRLFVGCAGCLFASMLWGQPLPADPNLADLPRVYGPNLIRSLHPVSDAADLLRHSYLKVITYEDPLWQWPGEMRVLSPRADPATKRASSPAEVSFALPGGNTQALDLPARLAQVLAAYHEQTGGPRFQVLTSKLGLHIVPLQVRNRDGQFAPAQNPLDKLVFIPQQERTAHGHLLALDSALVAANDGLNITISPKVVDLRGDSFNFMFAPTRADDRPFVWGTAVSNMTGRDALIDLLDRSATTFYWDMRCLGALTVGYNQCHMYVAPLEITTDASGGQSVNSGGKILTMTGGKRVIEYDRCGGCEGGRALTHLEQSREKNKK